MNNSDKGIAIISYLQWNLKKGIVDVPCYSSPAVQADFRKKIWICCKDEDIFHENTEIIKILAPLTDNPNTPNDYGDTPISWAAYKGYTEIVKILVSLTDNPNAPNKNGTSPIHKAARNGNTEIVKILAPLTDNPNAPNKNGESPSSLTKNAGIRKILTTSRKRKAGPKSKPSMKQAKK